MPCEKVNVMSNAFEGKIAVVTGGTSGIGGAVSEELLKRGATVWVIGSRQESVEKAKKSLAAYPKARFAAVDVTVGDQVKEMIGTCVRVDGRLDYLFNNAGIGMTHPSRHLTLDMWKKAVDLNLWGVIYGIHYALPVMLAQKGGHIVNTSSVAGIIAPPSQAVYCATKYAVTGMTESLRYEFSDQGISFTTVCPANVATAIFGSAEVPKEAIPADEAARIILDGVEKKEGLVIFPEFARNLYERFLHDPDLKERFMLEYAKRRNAGWASGVPYLGIPDDMLGMK
ncbi:MULTISPECIES: SDR family oxidoreductase [unclassified Methanoregula]|uniref:SDR family NAD(P)-dependent oxidoreductase n=1 Tax=unclassified Methanoregula TaxID=2649730 RepID=UPI0009C8BA6E|nr:MULTISPECIES: SDR family oxidoreductase [unclassified Methanoregula]OPX62186.1 MAG: 3-ketoacyl-(acyl-carrier-protein) reductase [Methanoregula sp. PtaB.Bin085]OPY35605.1 MAG: 3-ketoacyl-(acyl-carrier-protein) reductase [Methanoregula sp. PtaU1.Bin006]